MLEVIEEKKKILIGVLAGLTVFGLIAIPFLLRKKKGKVISPLSQEAQESEEGEFLLWDDEAGFTFQYPDGLYIDDHPEDMENYAHLEITSTKEADGRILILVNNATIETIDEWVEQDEEATMAGILDSTLADAPAKKLLFNDPKRVLTAVIDSYEGLYLLELQPGEGDYWQKVYDQIVTTFAFKPLTEEEQEILEQAGGGEETSGGNVVYEAEEIIE